MFFGNDDLFEVCKQIGKNRKFSKCREISQNQKNSHSKTNFQRKTVQGKLKIFKLRSNEFPIIGKTPDTLSLTNQGKFLNWFKHSLT